MSVHRRPRHPAALRHHLRPRLVTLACLSLLGSSALAQSGAATGSDAATSLSRVTITSTLPDRLEAVPGSSTVIGSRQLEAERPYSIREALQSTPGLHVVGEDAFGVNLNIGIRGLDPRRSSRTLLLEDGMPIHLAPYSDPSSHYHTPLERLQRVEVIRGSGQIVHGPQTVGGVINFVTRPTPRKFTAGGEVALGNRGFSRIQAGVGNGGEWGGWLAEAGQRQGDGTREHHHHRLRDLSLKTDLNLSATQSLGLKLQHYREDSRFSEAGLDQARFDANPYANPFRHDVFELERSALQAVHRIDLGSDARLSTQVYVQRTQRTSFRQLDAIAEFDGVGEEDGERVAEIENEALRSLAPDEGTPNPACQIAGEDIDYRVPGGFENYAAFCGNQMRPRTYRIYGIEPRLELGHRAFGLRQELIAGARLHKEDIERRRYNGSTPTSREDSPGTYYRDRNDIDTQAVALYAQNTFHLDGWTLTPGLRMERYEQRNIAVLAREDREANNGRSVTQKHTRWLPGLGATWYGLPGTTVFAGLHRGFAPPRPDANLSPTDDSYTPVHPEVSTNLELGVRSSPAKGLQWEATLFRIDFRNQIVPGYAVGLGQTFANAGRSRHQGLELAGRLDLGPLSARSDNVYLVGSWTWLPQAEFASNLQVPAFEPGENETETFRNARGKRLPYAPRHTASLNLGYESASGWDARIGLQHVGSQYSDALNTVAPDPNGQSGAIAAYTTVNASVNLRLPVQGLRLYLSATNLADRQYLVSRVNGAQPGARRQLVAGLKYSY